MKRLGLNATCASRLLQATLFWAVATFVGCPADEESEDDETSEDAGADGVTPSDDGVEETDPCDALVANYPNPADRYAHCSETENTFGEFAAPCERTWDCDGCLVTFECEVIPGNQPISQTCRCNVGDAMLTDSETTGAYNCTTPEEQAIAQCFPDTSTTAPWPPEVNSTANPDANMRECSDADLAQLASCNGSQVAYQDEETEEGFCQFQWICSNLDGNPCRYAAKCNIAAGNLGDCGCFNGYSQEAAFTVTQQGDPNPCGQDEAQSEQGARAACGL